IRAAVKRSSSRESRVMDASLARSCTRVATRCTLVPGWHRHRRRDRDGPATTAGIATGPAGSVHHRPVGREHQVRCEGADRVTDQQRSALTPEGRAEHLSRLRGATADSPLDVLVVGGGVNGAGAAFDAATRGLSVGLVESHDWASGTSSRSSKLMHGGLRYLQMLDFKLVAE